MRLLEKAMAADPSYEEPFFFYGNLLVDDGRYEDAIPYLRKAVKIRSDYVTARVLLARALMQLRQFPTAIAELDLAVNVDPRHPQPHLLLSQIYFRMGLEERAAQEKELSLRLRRENPRALEAEQGRSFFAKP
jgi:tetratricopeptide (TPR) repeat protein